MACPQDKLTVIKQFNDDPDKVWTEYEANNPGFSETHLKIYLDSLYAHCFAKHAPVHLPETSFNLPQPVRDAITKCVVTTKIPV